MIYLAGLETSGRRRMLGKLRRHMAYQESSEEMRACLAGPFLIGRYRRLAASVNAAERKAANTGAWMGLAGAVAGGIASTAVWAALLWLLASGRISLAAGGGAVFALQTATGSVRGIINGGARLVRTGWYVQDWQYFLDNAHGQAMTDSRGTAPVTAAPERFEVRDVTYRYDGAPVHVRYRPLWDRPLHRGPVPGHLPVQQAWAWCFVPDGRVVLVADPGPRGALPMLPGGTVEDTDAMPEDTLHREAAEEAQLTLADPVRLGWVLDETGEVYGGVGPNARLRLAARVTAIGPAAVDPATGHPFARLLATPAQAAVLLGWGPPGARQAQLAAETARERWGLPTARAAAIEEIPAEGMRLT
ncbi:NUDIX hydrolase [Streptomyces sp. NBC_01788]|uniref:NUDIX hydrolase n=1 Tax=Streptomyces sp. NBC_01788 TaxID=2975940 RepID=UPI002DD7A137|nr:NUDIX hydrolase [Streptomyces sp. NBC_01788]WSB25243.1 NUDIX hydrolase [Streptomyces sp. NBC_01788]